MPRISFGFPKDIQNQPAESHAGHAAGKVDQDIDHTAVSALIGHLDRLVQNGDGEEKKQFKKESAVKIPADDKNGGGQDQPKEKIFRKMRQLADRILREDDVMPHAGEKPVQDAQHKTALQVGLNDRIH